jgi:hypothetical protein
MILLPVASFFQSENPFFLPLVADFRLTEFLRQKPRTVVSGLARALANSEIVCSLAFLRMYCFSPSVSLLRVSMIKRFAFVGSVHLSLQHAFFSKASPLPCVLESQTCTARNYYSSASYKVFWRSNGRRAGEPYSYRLRNTPSVFLAASLSRKMFYSQTSARQPAYYLLGESHMQEYLPRYGRPIVC